MAESAPRKPVELRVRHLRRIESIADAENGVGLVAKCAAHLAQARKAGKGYTIYQILQRAGKDLDGNGGGHGR